MRIDVVTIFPEFFSVLDVSLLGRARSGGVLDFRVHDLRDFTHDRHRTVDDTPAGGGAGMVMKPEPWGEALDAILTPTSTVVFPTPAGALFRQATARDLSTREHLVFCCGRYEGIDQRVIDDTRDRVEVLELSLGDYVLNGGEVAAMAMIEAAGRLVPGVVGNPESLVEESHEDGLLEYPSYTKPAVWRGRKPHPCCSAATTPRSPRGAARGSSSAPVACAPTCCRRSPTAEPDRRRMSRMKHRGWIWAQFAVAAVLLVLSVIGILGVAVFDAAELAFSFAGAIHAFAVFPGLILSLVVNALLMRAHRELGVSLTEKWLLGVEFALIAVLLVLHFWSHSGDALGLAILVWPVLIVLAITLAVLAGARNASRGKAVTTNER